jgi:hypothetical protein
MLLYLILTVFGVVFLLEGATSLFLYARDATTSRPSRDNERPYLHRDRLLGWSNRAGAVSANEYGKDMRLRIDTNGFRANSSATALPNAPLLACSGDAYTFGYGVDDAHPWCALLQRELGVRTTNLGEPAFGLDQSFLRYARDGVPHRPAIHVVALTDLQLERALSDRYEGSPKPSFVLHDGHLSLRDVPVPEPGRLGLQRAYARRLLEDFRFVQWLRSFSSLSRPAVMTRAIRRDWAMFDALIDSMSKLDSAQSTSLALVYLPTRRDLRPGPLDARRELIARSATAHGIAFIDLAPALRTMRPDSQDHAFIASAPRGAAPGVTNQYSNLGNAWVARELSTRLRSLPTLQSVLPSK